MLLFVNYLSGKLRTTAILSLICLTTLLSGKAFATDWYVSATNGNDQNNTGKSTGSPFRTIQKAADNAVSGDVVYVRAGTYREGVNMKADGVTYQAYPGETVIINGAELLTSWTLESGSTYKTTMNWDVDDSWGTNQAFSDGKMIELARWPDQTSTDLIMPTNAKADEATALNGSKVTVVLKDNDFNEPDGRWVGAQIWINTSRNGSDGNGMTAVVKATSQANHTITFDWPYGESIFSGPFSVGQNTEYYLYNPTATGVNATGGVDALLSKGEWWKNGTTLYVKTPDGGAPSSTGTGSNVIEAKKNHFAFYTNVNGTLARANYTIRNFTLFACAINTHYKVRDQTVVEAAHDILIENINAKYVSHELRVPGVFQDSDYQKSGFVISGKNITVKNCKIQYSAASAISVQGYGNKILNCELIDCNYACSNAGAMNTGFVSTNQEIGYCKILNTPIMGINIKNFKNADPNTPDVARIHHNEIGNFMRRSGDSGGIDGVSLDAQWARIDHNIIYNAPDAPMQHGIYLDFGGGSNGDIGRFTIDHNVIYNVWVPGLFNHVTYLNIYNNVFLNSGSEYSAINANAGSTPVNGENIKMYNNIFSKKPNNDGCCYGATLNNADIKSYIHIADGLAGTSLNDLFVDAANHDYHLKSTATAAINKGISVGKYDDSDVVGLPDIGAYEYTGSTTTTLRDPENPSNAVSGLDYKYYEGTWSTLPSFGSLTAVKTGTSTTGFDLSTRNKDDYFGYQFTGYVNIPSDGTYTFYTSSDDGSKLYIGTTEVVNNDGLHASVEKSGTIGLKAGKHAITVVFFENGGGQSLSVSYSGPNLSKQTIPTSALYRAGTASTTEADRTDPVGTGTITSRGQIADYEGREKAFDNDVNTKWLDQSAQSWIQYTFAGSAKYAVSKYSITSANDVPERDPRDWKLYGSNVANPVFPGDFTEVDSRTNVTFDNFKQKKEFTTSSSSTAYRTYRLTITANRGNGTPAIIQLSEIELFAPDCSTCRLASAEVESSELSLQLHPNPANQEVTISLAGFEAESSVEVKMSDMRGQSFLHRQVQPRVAGKQVTLSVGQLPQGLFFVTVQGSKARKTAKLIITK
jgi:hypothetical protein